MKIVDHDKYINISRHINSINNKEIRGLIDNWICLYANGNAKIVKINDHELSLKSQNQTLSYHVDDDSYYIEIISKFKTEKITVTFSDNIVTVSKAKKYNYNTKKAIDLCGAEKEVVNEIYYDNILVYCSNEQYYITSSLEIYNDYVKKKENIFCQGTMIERNIILGQSNYENHPFFNEFAIDEPTNYYLYDVCYPKYFDDTEYHNIDYKSKPVAITKKEYEELVKQSRNINKILCKKRGNRNEKK